MLQNKKIAALGAGKLGETLIKGLLETGVINIDDVRVTAGHQQRLDQMRVRFNVSGTLSNKTAAEAADIIIVAVKPQTVPYGRDSFADRGRARGIRPDLPCVLSWQACDLEVARRTTSDIADGSIRFASFTIGCWRPATRRFGFIARC